MEKKKEIQLNDAVVLPVMMKHKIGRAEAEKRLQLLYQSSILEGGHPGDRHTQRLIDGFLAQDSEVLAETVLFEKTVTLCLESKEFVNNYDRITGSAVSKVLGMLRAGKRPPNAKKELEKFTEFVRETVFSRIAQTPTAP